MKKILCIVMAIALLLLCGCNYNIVDTKWTFNYAYITVGGKTIEVEVKYWNDNDGTNGGNDITITDINDVTYCTDYKNVVLTTERVME